MKTYFQEFRFPPFLLIPPPEIAIRQDSTSSQVYPFIFYKLSLKSYIENSF